MIDLKCILQYDPKPLSGKVDSMFKPWWMIATCSGDLTEFYTWLLNKETGMVLQRPAWGAHVSVIRGEEPPNVELWKKYDNQEITITYDPDVRTNSEHWWMRVHSNDLLDIREELGLIRFPEFTFHLTLGRPSPKYASTSEYFHKVYKSKTILTRPPMTQEETIKNLSLKPLEVNHKDLEEAQSDSMFRKKCPNCNIGLLMMRRNPNTFFLQKDDACTYCGRRFIYTDIKENSITLEYTSF
jgi:hypothetical protein